MGGLGREGPHRGAAAGQGQVRGATRTGRGQRWEFAVMVGDPASAFKASAAPGVTARPSGGRPRVAPGCSSGPRTRRVAVLGFRRERPFPVSSVPIRRFFLMPSRAVQLFALGQSVWLDFIRRGHLVSGEFDSLVRDQGIVGVTSNPTIFHQAITQSDDYDAALSKLVAEGLEPVAIFDRLSVEDIQMACDRLRPVYDRTGGTDGRVSIE